MRADCYHGTDVETGRVGLPPDGPQKAVHLLNDADLLIVGLVRVFGDDGHLQAFLRFTHRLHLGVLPQINAVVLDFFGAVGADQGIEVSQNLQREGRVHRDMLTHRSAVQNHAQPLFASYSCLSDNKGGFGAQGGQNASHFHSNITSTHNHTAPIGETRSIQTLMSNNTQLERSQNLTLGGSQVQRSHHC